MEITAEVLRALPPELRVEVEENALRKDFTPTELVAVKRDVERYIKSPVGRPLAKNGGKLPPFLAGKTREKAARLIGVGARTLDKAEQVVKAAEDDPATFAPLVAEMDKTRKVDLAHKKLTRIRLQQSREQAAAVTPAPSSAIVTGDFRVAAKDVPDGSVDTIFTDPPYAEEYLTLFDDLGVFAARVLKPGGLLLTYSGVAYLPQVQAALAEHLAYMWAAIILHPGSETRFRNYNVRQGWKPILIYYKPPLTVWWPWFGDVVSGKREKALHEWQQCEADAEHYIKALTPTGGLVIDPFCGSGTTLVVAKRLGLRHLGFEIDPLVAAGARQRLGANDGA